LIAKWQDFTIWMAEPLSNILVEWLIKSQDYLFTSNRLSKRPYLDPTRAYEIVRTVEANFNGLVDAGKIDLPKVKLFNHWFRAMRASQLVKNYHYDEFRLKRS
jgi:hypothetical protein